MPADMTYDETCLIAADGQRLQAYEWAPEATPRAAVCLVHGLGEHAGRYAHVAQAFADAGFGTLAFDLRGHGRTPGPRGHAPSFDVVMDDIGLLLEQAAQGFPATPRFLYGHSLGGSLVLNYALRRQPDVAGVVATSPGLRPARPISWTTRAAARLARRVWPSWRLPNGLDVEGISRDPAVVARYDADPLVHSRVSARFGLESIEAGEWAIAHAGCRCCSCTARPTA
jgi:alpha-beta hydrolase superfamily lysophospholipase